MPIIDPSLQCCLVNKFTENSKKQRLNFFLYYLRIASHFMHKNVATVETSILFRDDLKRSIIFINDELGCDFNIGQDFNFAIKDYYKYLYDRIDIKTDKDKKSRTQKGSYFICSDQFNTKLYRPCNLYTQQHAWFLSDTPIAILCINDKLLNAKFTQYVKLEIDLMVAAGYTLVLCAIGTPDTINFYLQLIKDNQFAEIHFNILDDSYIPKFLKTVEESLHSHFDYYKGYFYLYSHFPSKEIESIASKLNKRPRFQTIFFVKSIDKTFLRVDLYASKPFSYCKAGFKSKYLRIKLSNVPLYDSSNSYTDLIPSKVSNFSLGYISPSDFLTWQKKRIKILFSDLENDNRHIKKYIDFDDLHKMKADYYAIAPMLLQNISKHNLNEVKKIQNKIKKKDDKNRRFRKEIIFSLFKDQKIKEGLEYVGYAYQLCFRKEIKDFTLHDEQILTALEACKTFVTRINNPKDKGMIYQVKTGEGKSCIVCLIAAVLALMGKTVHITSSNIKLANRDYYKSFNFFKTLGFESAILLHENELPFFSSKYENKENDTNNNDDDNNNDSISLNELSDSTNGFSLNESGKDLEYDELFGSGSSNYLFKSLQSEKSAFKSDYYPEKFFKSDLFKNPSRMNFSVCGIDSNNRITKNKADIIFSTFVNFECLYLRIMETCQGYVDEYFKGCGLIIDEVDSILIDEITNGTIVSREMKSNAKPILKYVYQQQRNNRPVQETYDNIVKYWPNYGSLELKDIEQMYEEIELVNEAEFSNGKKYSIETIQVKNSSKIQRLFKKTTKTISKATNKVIKKIQDKLVKDKNDKDDDFLKIYNHELEENYIDSDNKIEFQAITESGEEEEDYNNDIENDEDEEIADTSVVEFKHIVPFDYDHKGILEPNKEFSGFIQQFIAIKEGLQKGNENMIIKDLSMNYLYVSHPIFVKLYGKVCGFTGTIGSKSDQDIYKNLYHLKIKKVPRNKPTLKVKLPMILCDTIDERDRFVVAEVKAFHDKGFPVLVIFQDLNEIVKVEYLLNSKQINFINIFDGKNEVIKPDKIAGVNAAVSLGTNVCGRGTDIKIQSKPLHVILTYYSSNKRVMRQAFGRTGRQGQKGTYRVICLKEQYFDPIQIVDGLVINKAIKDFNIKNKQQEMFIDYFKNKRPWIFSGEIKKQKINNDQIAALRKAQINVNRIIAYNYEFPICMKTETFLDIQAQKIFSIFNCPNSKYTWILFQRYLREMILESWSLMLNKFDQENFDKQGTEEYNNLLHEKRKELYKQIEYYIKVPIKSSDSEIIPTFMHIHQKVLEKYQDQVLNIYKKMPGAYKSFNSSGFISCQFGFRPYSLLSNSGARINVETIGEMNYIIDPELRYERKMPDGNRLTIVSITEHIDSIFNMICQMIGRLISEKIGLKLFLRRTLGGCEFGLCFDLLMQIDDIDSEILNDFYCLVDKDPLLSFTIFVKNVFPILAGILIIVLVFVSCLATQISAWIGAFLPKLSEEILKKGIKLIIEFAAESFMKSVLQKLFFYLSEIVEKQIKDIMMFDLKTGLVLENLFRLFQSITFTTFGEKISDSFGRKIKINLKSKFGRLIKGSIHHGILLKIGLILILSIATFIMNFNHSKQSLKNESRDAREFDKHYDPNTAERLKERNINKVKLKKMTDFNNDDNNDENEENQLKHGFSQFIQTSMDSFLFKMDLSNPSNFIVDPNNFKIDILSSSKKNRIGNAYINYYWQTSIQKKCFRIQYYGNTKAFKQQVVFLATFNNNHPLIVPFVGFYVERKNDFIYHQLPENGFLDEYIIKEEKDKLLWSPSAKLIIAYGIAYVMKYLHDECHIVHRDLKPANICLDQLLYPYIFNFYYAKQIDKNEKSKILIETSLRFMAPEFIENPLSCQNSFKIDVYSYGMLLYNLITEIQPFNDFVKKDDLINAIVSGERPKFPSSVLPEWKDLIKKCWAQDPNERFSFNEILNELNSPKFVNEHINTSIFSRYKKEFLKDNE